METNEKKPRGVRNPVLDLIIKLVETGALKTMSGSTCKVLNVLISHRNSETGTCWPSILTVQRKAGISRRQVFRALSWLIAAGIIDRKRGGPGINFVNVYHVNLNPYIIIPPTPIKSKKKLALGCHNKTTEGITEKGQKRPKGVTDGPPSLGTSNDTHLLGVKTEPQKNLSIRGSIKKGKSPYKISKKISEEWKKLKGEEWLEEQINKGGYVISD